MNEQNSAMELAERIPANVLFGTSSWTYPGWKGIVYQRTYGSDKAFKHDCLGEYAAYPWFRTMGIDSAFYAPLPQELLRSYDRMVPADFRWISKVWERLTIPAYPTHARYGKNAGQTNPDFLNAEMFIQEVLGPYSDPNLRRHLGAFVFQFPTISSKQMPRAEFFERLDGFLSALPQDFRYATEIRNPEYLGRDYFQLINRHCVTHCFNHWHRMPPLRAQMLAAAEAGGLRAPFFVARLLTPLGVSYEQAVKLFAPYNRLQRPNPEMRADVVRLALRAIERKMEAFIIVNNRLEGHAPGTIAEIGAMLVERIDNEVE